MYLVLIFIFFIIVQWLFCLNRIKIDLNRTRENDTFTYVNINKKWRKRFCITVCTEMILFTGFRALDIGADTSTYLNALEYYKSLPRNEIISAKLVYPFDFEVGYFLLTKICAYLNFSSTAFLLLVSIIIYIPLFIFIGNYSIDPLISILAYFAFGLFTYSLGLFRQMMALSICLCAIPFVKKRRIVKCLLIYLLAALFHLTALIMIPFYFLNLIDLKRHRLLFLISIFTIEVFSFIFARDIIIRIIHLIPNYAGYEGSAYDVEGGTYLGLIYLNTLLFFGVWRVLPFVRNEDALWIKGIAVACILQSCSYAMGIMGRLVCYYSVYSVILIPLIEKHLIKELGIAKIIFTILLLGLIIITMSRDTAVIQNYRFIWG